MIDRKEAKRKYKEGHRPMGVFRVRHTQSGRSLVGCSVDLPSIFNRIRMQLNTGSYLKHRQLQRDWNEHGPDAFEFEVLQELEPEESPTWDPRADLAALEQLWLEELEPWGEQGYHRSPPAET